MTVKIVVGSLEKTEFGRTGMAQIGKQLQGAQRRPADSDFRPIPLWMR
jgi:hypothetical protein